MEYKYRPEFAGHPGKMLKNLIEAQGGTEETFKARSGLSKGIVANLLRGTQPIYLPLDILIGIEKATGVDKEFWGNLFDHYRNHRDNPRKAVR